MRSRPLEILLATTICAGLVSYLFAHTSNLDLNGSVNGFVPSVYTPNINYSVHVLPGLTHLIKNQQTVNYYSHVFFVAYNPLLIFFAASVALTLIKYYNELDRRPLFVLVNQLSVALIAAIVGEVVFFVYTFYDVDHTGPMLPWHCISIICFGSSICVSFYLLSLSLQPIAVYHDDPS